MNNRLLSYHPLNADFGILLLRLIFGGLMFYHGYSKVMAYNQILPMFGDLVGIGSKNSFHLVIFAEFICGALVVLGLFTRLAVIPILIAMAVAFFVAHGKDPFQVKELAFFFLTLSIPVFILGSGRYSIDHLIFNKRAY
jgi:putative oxidoreductase